MSRRGSVLGLAAGVILVLATLGATLLTRSAGESELGRRSAAQQRAFYLAEAGVDRAAINLRTPSDAGDDLTTQALPTGSYQLDEPESLGSDRWRVVSHGTSGSEQRDLEAVFRLTPQSAFQFGLFGDMSLNVSGSATTDSYQSSAGPYQASSAGHSGDVGTNATAPGGVTVGGSIFIDGQIAVGPDVAVPESVVIGYDPAFVTGVPKVVSQANQFPMPPVVVDEAPFTAVLGDGDGDCQDYTVAGNTTTTLSSTGGLLGQGVYCYRNLVVQGNADLTANGSVKVVIVGSLRAQGNSEVGVEEDPTKMLVLISSNAPVTLEEGTITGSTEFYGALYGPSATITITGNADVFGSIIAKTINVTGSAAIHYDEALASDTDFSNQYQASLVSWQELD